MSHFSSFGSSVLLKTQVRETCKQFLTAIVVFGMDHDTSIHPLLLWLQQHLLSELNDIMTSRRSEWNNLFLPFETSLISFCQSFQLSHFLCLFLYLSFLFRAVLVFYLPGRAVVKVLWYFWACLGGRFSKNILNNNTGQKLTCCHCPYYTIGTECVKRVCMEKLAAGPQISDQEVGIFEGKTEYDNEVDDDNWHSNTTTPLCGNWVINNFIGSVYN